MSYAPTRSLVTGASSGIGAAFGRALAGRGSDLVLVARREDRMNTLASELRGKFGIEAEVVVLDLSASGAMNMLKDRITSAKPIDTIINCAGFGTYGPFVAEDEVQVREEIQVHVGAVVDVTRAFLPEMVQQGRGAIVNVASLFAYQPAPDMAIYGAAKAFVLNFTEALWYETRKTGVKVLAISPGPTRTEFFDSLGDFEVPKQVFQSPEQVVGTTLRALDRRISPPSVTSGGLAYVLSRGTRLIPRRAAIRIAALLT